MNLVVTDHAVQRYRERVRNCSDSEARTALSSMAVHAAVSIGAPYVRLPTGQRILIHGGVIITVLPSNTARGAMSMARDQKHFEAWKAKGLQ